MSGQRSETHLQQAAEAEPRGEQGSPVELGDAHVRRELVALLLGALVT